MRLPRKLKKKIKKKTLLFFPHIKWTDWQLAWDKGLVLKLRPDDLAGYRPAT